MATLGIKAARAAPGLNGRLDELRLLASLVLVIGVSGAVAWWHAFGSIEPYDDEGTLMLSVSRFLGGRVLYDALQSNYGPLYYFYQWLPRALTGTPVSHDSLRMISVTCWVAAGLVLFLLVYRATGSLLLALGAHFVGFRAMGFIGDQAGHPQEMCILLLIGIVLAATFRPPVSFAWFGVLAAASLLTKVNLGALVLVAFAVVATLALPRGSMRRVLAPLVWLGALAAPFVLVSAHLTEQWALFFALLVTISLGGAILIASASTPQPLRIADLLIALLAGLVTLALIASFVLARGSTVHGMIQSLIVWPRTRFAAAWTIPLSVPIAALVWALVCFALACFAFRQRMPDRFIPGLKLALAVFIAVAEVASWHSGILLFATPLLWLVGVPASGASKSERSFLRPLLAVLGVLQVLYAYPVAGVQVAFVTVIMVPIAAICAWDALPRFIVSANPATIGRSVASGLALLIALYGVSAFHEFHWYESLEPLGLPGAAWLRVKPATATALRRLRIEIASQHCSMLMAEPGLFSLNLFTGVQPPYSLRSGAWVILMNDAEQAAAVREMEAQPRACVIYNPRIVKVWTRGREPAARPLVRFIRDNFRTEFEIRGYQFMVRHQDGA